MIPASCPQIDCLPEFIEYKDGPHSNLNILDEEKLVPFKKGDVTSLIVTKLYGEFFMYNLPTTSYSPVVSYGGTFAMRELPFFTEIYNSPSPITLAYFQHDRITNRITTHNHLQLPKQVPQPLCMLYHLLPQPAPSSLLELQVF